MQPEVGLARTRLPLPSGRRRHSDAEKLCDAAAPEIAELCRAVAPIRRPKPAPRQGILLAGDRRGRAALPRPQPPAAQAHAACLASRRRRCSTNSV